MPDKNDKIKALFEVLKDFLRWALAGFLGWFIPNGAAWIMSFFTQQNITPPPYFEAGLAVAIKYLDYWLHRYNKERMPGRTGESLGIFKV